MKKAHRCVASDHRRQIAPWEAEDQLNALRSRIGQDVPLSNRYVRVQRAILVSVDGETATLRFSNGSTLARVPLRDLVDDSGYWKP